MRPSVQIRMPTWTGIVLVPIFLATSASRAVAAEKAPPSIRAEAELSFLLDQLKQTIREEDALQEKRRDAAEAVSRPHAEYLLYQGSVRFAEQDARLTQLKMNKIEILQRLALLQEETGHSTWLLRGLAENSAGRGYPPYSGAPLLSFDHTTRLTPGALPSSYFGIILFRLFSISTLILVFVFPAMAIEKGTVDLRRKGRTWMASRYSRIKKGLRGRPPGETVRRAMKKAAPGATPRAA